MSDLRIIYTTRPDPPHNHLHEDFCVMLGDEQIAGPFVTSHEAMVWCDGWRAGRGADG